MTVTTPAAFAEFFPRATAVFQQGRERGLHHGLQVFVSRHGKVLADVALGEAEPGSPLSANHWLMWLSAGKPITVAAWARFWERDSVRLDSPVAKLIPEFGHRGKQRMTWRHVLTHTAGLRSVEHGWPELTWEETLSRINTAGLDDGAVLGRTAGYHTASTWFLLGEALQRLAGQPFVDVLRDEVLGPLGMTETHAAIDVASLPQFTSRFAPMWEREKGVLQRLDWHEPPNVARPSPGSSLRGPIRELGQFYEALRRDGQGPQGRWLSPITLAAMTARHRVGEFDATLGHVVDFGLGFLLDSNRYGADTVPYGYGRYCSPRTFGHGGAQCAQGFCDPEADLVVAWAFNSRCGEPQHQRRAKALNEALYVDAGVVTE